MEITEPSQEDKHRVAETEVCPEPRSAAPVAGGTQLAPEQLGFELQGPLLGGFKKIINTVNPL